MRVLPILYRRCRHLLQRLRGLWIATLVRLGGGTVGPRLLAERGVRLRYFPTSGWVVGSDVYLGAGVDLGVGVGATFELGDRVQLHSSCVVGVEKRVTIGARTLVAESVTIRDANHRIDSDAVIIESGMEARPTSIGADVWIGRGAAILAGAQIADHAVVGANSVVNGRVNENEIVAGAPARVLRTRRR